MRSYVPRRQNPIQGLPLFVYFHGGGWMFGDIESGDLSCSTLSANLDMAVLNVDYRLALQWKFPRGLEDSYDTVKWVSQRPKTMNPSFLL